MKKIKSFIENMSMSNLPLRGLLKAFQRARIRFFYWEEQVAFYSISFYSITFSSHFIY